MKLNAGEHRPIYFWAGPSTIRMNLLKRDLPIDRRLYLEAYQEKGIDMMEQMGHTMAYLMYNWGWEPEIEKEDWQAFQEALKLCHQRGIETFAYISTSNIVYGDWFTKHPEGAGWMCRDRAGSMFSYPQTHRRAICCFNNDNWVRAVGKIVRQALSLGPDGIFLDNISQGECYCPVCQRKYGDFLKKEGMEVVDLKEIKCDVKDPYYRAYCRFRCKAVEKCFARIKEVIQEVDPSISLVSNTGQIVEENNIVGGGIDPSRLIKYQNLWMIENLTFPHIDEGVVVNNCMTYKVARALGDDKPVSSMPYIHGAKEKISGVEQASVMYTPREFKLQIAEASSQNASAVIKGTEYYDQYWTLVTDERFGEQRKAIREYHRFLEERKELYQNTKDVSNIGLLYSQNSMAWVREESFPSFCGFFQTLYQNHIPFEIVTEEQLEKGWVSNNDLIIVPSVGCFSEKGLRTLERFLSNGGRLFISGKFATHDLKGNPTYYKLTEKIQNHSSTTYYEECPAITVEKNRLFNRNVAIFLLPHKADEIVRKIEKLIKLPVEVKANYSEGVTVWGKANEYIVHLVNYGREKTDAEVVFPNKIRAWEGYSPDFSSQGRLKVKENLLKIENTDIYDVIRIKL